MSRYGDGWNDDERPRKLPMDPERAKREAVRDDATARVQRAIESLPPPPPPKVEEVTEPVTEPAPPPPPAVVEEPVAEPTKPSGSQKPKFQPDPADARPLWQQRRDYDKQASDGA